MTVLLNFPKWCSYFPVKRVDYDDEFGRLLTVIFLLSIIINRKTVWKDFFLFAVDSLQCVINS